MRREDRLITALLHSRPAGRDAAGLRAYCRFASLRAQIDEPYVREWLLGEIRRLAAGLGDGSECREAETSLLPRVATGFAFGAIPEADAHRLVELTRSAGHPVSRSNLLFAMRYTTSPVVHEHLAKLVNDRAWRSSEELRLAAEAMASNLVPESVAALASRLSDSEDDETVESVLRGLSYGRRPGVDAGPIVEQLRSRVTDPALASESASLRRSVLTAWRDFVVGWDLEPSGVVTALRLLADDRNTDAEDRSILRGAVAYFRPQHLPEFEAILGNARIPVAERRELVRVLVSNPLNLGRAGVDAWLASLAEHPRVPGQVLRSN